MNFRVLANYILVRLGARNVLPSYYIQRVKLNECNETLVEVDENIFIIDKRMKKPVYLRETVYKKLLEFSKIVIKDGYKIKLYDAYRSLNDQIESWNKRLEQTKQENPNLTENEIIQKTSLKVARPQKNNIGGHQTGGAIDITLVKDGKDLDMGTNYEEYSEKTFTNSKKISKEAILNRKYLKNNLENLGFKNFPAEWWHYSYGDKMWAAYNFNKECIYGYIEPEEQNEKKL